VDGFVVTLPIGPVIAKGVPGLSKAKVGIPLTDSVQGGLPKKGSPARPALPLKAPGLTFQETDVKVPPGTLKGANINGVVDVVAPLTLNATGPTV
jgi:hypothetical protein